MGLPPASANCAVGALATRSLSAGVALRAAAATLCIRISISLSRRVLQVLAACLTRGPGRSLATTGLTEGSAEERLPEAIGGRVRHAVSFLPTALAESQAIADHRRTSILADKVRRWSTAAGL